MGVQWEPDDDDWRCGYEPSIRLTVAVLVLVVAAAIALLVGAVA